MLLKSLHNNGRSIQKAKSIIQHTHIIFTGFGLASEGFHIFISDPQAHIFDVCPDVISSDDSSARGHGYVPSQDTEGGSLAGTIDTQQPKALPTGDGQADTTHSCLGGPDAAP